MSLAKHLRPIDTYLAEVFLDLDGEDPEEWGSYIVDELSLDRLSACSSFVLGVTV